MPEIKHTILRQKICNYAMCDKTIQDIPISKWIAWDRNIDLTSYVSQMRLTSTWGGAPEIKIFCEMYSIRVMVKDTHRDAKTKKVSNKWTEFLPESGAYLKTIHIIWSGGHYESDRTTKH